MEAGVPRCQPREIQDLSRGVNPSIMSEAGDDTVELLAPVRCRCRFPGTSSQLDEAQHNVKLLASW